MSHLPLVSTFPARLRALRERAGLSQQQLSDRAGVRKATVSDLERGVKSPSLSTLDAVAQALGVPPAELLRPEKS